MAYITQEMKKDLTPAIKAVLKKWNCKGSISIRNHSSLQVTITEGTIDFIADANEAAQKWAERTGCKAHEIKDSVNYGSNHRDGDKASDQMINELIAAMKGTSWYNNSDLMTDYFDIAYYVDVQVGRWDKPYKLVA